MIKYSAAPERKRKVRKERRERREKREERRETHINLIHKKQKNRGIY